MSEFRTPSEVEIKTDVADATTVEVGHHAPHQDVHIEEIANMEQFNEETLQEINRQAPACMDGRETLMIATKSDGKWEITVPAQEAAEIVEPHLPGAGLGFIAVLEKVQGLDRESAIKLAEKAMAEKGWTFQFHIDNHHGDVDLNGKTDQEVGEFLEHQIEGCGFAGKTWGTEASGLLKSLVERGWSVEVLGGHHNEGQAVAINESGKAINTAEATAGKAQAFTFNRPETKAVLELMGLGDEFVEKGMAWFDGEFKEIAKLLRQIDTIQSVG